MQGSVTKCGNPRVRAALIELAWLFYRHQSSYPPLLKWKEVLHRGGSAARKKAIVAVARQLAIDLWRLETGRATAQQLGLALKEEVA